MAAWIRNLIVLVVMACWSAYILTSLIRGASIETSIWGVPGIVYFALNPQWKRGGKEGGRE